MQKLKADQAWKRKNMIFYLLQNTRNLQDIYMRSPILAVTLHAALENVSTVPEGPRHCKMTFVVGRGYVELQS